MDSVAVEGQRMPQLQRRQELTHRIEEVKVEKRHIQRAAQEMARRIVLDSLVKDWLKASNPGVDVRAYLIEKLFPSLVLGCEKLLLEAEDRGLVSSGSSLGDFNPINYLAQFLMRHNPRFSGSEQSSYVRGMRAVLEQLRETMLEMDGNRLVQLRAIANNKLDERNRQETLRRLEHDRRQKAFQQQFNEWSIMQSGRVSLQLLLSALSGLEQRFPAEMQGRVRMPRVAGDQETLMDEGDYVRTLLDMCSDAPSDVFDLVVQHLSVCAEQHRQNESSTQRHKLLSELFHMCDAGRTGALHRKRVMDTLASFFASMDDDERQSRVDPALWSAFNEEHDELSEEAADGEVPAEESASEPVAEEAPAEPAPSAEGAQADSQPDGQIPLEAPNEDDADDEAEQHASRANSASPTAAQPKRSEPVERSRSMAPLLRPDTSSTSSFDPDVVTEKQFVRLCENVLVGVDSATVQRFRQLFSRQYMETEQDRASRLLRHKLNAELSERQRAVERLFYLMDADGQNWIEWTALASGLRAYREGVLKDAVAVAQERLSSRGWPGHRLHRGDFHALFDVLTASSGVDRVLDVLNYLSEVAERQRADKLRAEQRRRWLSGIEHSALVAAASLEPVLQAVFQALLRDADLHGESKRLSASIADLRRSEEKDFLRFLACTPDDADTVIGRHLQRASGDVRFQAMDKGRPQHVARARAGRGVEMWNPDKQEHEGAFVAIPIVDGQEKVLGVLSVDTLLDPRRTVFTQHEIHFYEGVATSFAHAHQHVHVRRQLLRMAESALSWIQQNVSKVLSIHLYLVEPDTALESCLRLMQQTDPLGNVHSHVSPPRLVRKENLFRQYLFDVLATSEPVVGDAYGERHLAFPLRDEQGQCMSVVDVSIGEHRALAHADHAQIQKMLRLMQMAHREMSELTSASKRRPLLDVERRHEESQPEVVFDRLVLTELHRYGERLSADAIAELRSYQEPSKMIHEVVRATLWVFRRDEVESGVFDTWNSCRNVVNSELMDAIRAFDPTDGQLLDTARLQGYLPAVGHGAVFKHGSLPAEYLFKWLNICISLVKHTTRIRALALEQAHEAQ